MYNAGVTLTDEPEDHSEALFIRNVYRTVFVIGTFDLLDML